MNENLEFFRWQPLVVPFPQRHLIGGFRSGLGGDHSAGQLEQLAERHAVLGALGHVLPVFLHLRLGRRPAVALQQGPLHIVGLRRIETHQGLLLGPALAAGDDHVLGVSPAVGVATEFADGLRQRRRGVRQRIGCLGRGGGGLGNRPEGQEQDEKQKAHGSGNHAPEICFGKIAQARAPRRCRQRRRPKTVRPTPIRMAP